jgi:hypothetical protein
VAPEARWNNDTFPLWRGAIAAAATYFIVSNFADAQSALGLAAGSFWLTYQWQQVRIPKAGLPQPRYKPLSAGGGPANDTALSRAAGAQ